MPKISRIVLTNADGKEVAGDMLGEIADPGRARVLYSIPRSKFETCPICWAAPADSAEHVPPRALGGVVATSTCEECNNKFGSWTEAGLQDWFDHAAKIRLHVPGRSAPVGSGRVLLLNNADGPTLLIPDGTSNPLEGAAEYLHGSASGVEVTIRGWSSAEVKIGMLKSAFLAACLALGGVPDVSSAREIHAELMMVRSAGRRAELVAGPRAQALRFYRCRPEGELGVNGQLEVPGFGQVEVPTLCGVDQGVGCSPPRR